MDMAVEWGVVEAGSLAEPVGSRQQEVFGAGQSPAQVDMAPEEFVEAFVELGSIVAADKLVLPAAQEPAHMAAAVVVRLHMDPGKLGWPERVLVRERLVAADLQPPVAGPSA